MSACSTTAVTDGQVNANLRGYETQQTAIKTLNDSGDHRVASYSLAKAQCWLDVSYHEYTRNDRSAFVPEALTESQRITDYLAAGHAPSSADNPANTTPLVNDAAQLRQDLWDLAANLKQQPGFTCAAQQVGCAEVELVHAGNEFNQQGWRHAKPYVQMAEDLVAEATQAITSCPTKPEPTVAEEPLRPETITILTNVLFNFDQHTMDQALPSSLIQLNDVIGKINQRDYELVDLKLIGHADRSNNTGNPDYNLRLSEKRASSVLDYLGKHGIDTADTPMTHRGDLEQVNVCAEKTKSKKELENCLLPNRRVEVRFELRSIK